MADFIGMRLGDLNTAISLGDMDGRTSTEHNSLFVRTSRVLPFIDLIPNACELSSTMRLKIKNIGNVSLELFLTSKAERDLTTTAGNVAIVVPTYMDESYIVETLNSIKNQNYHDYEVVIVNDGSNDNTTSIILDYMSIYSDSLAIKFVKIPHTGHPGISRNVMLYNFISEQTEFVSFMDGDDLYATSDAISSLVGGLNKNDKAFAVYGDYDMISDDGVQIARPRGIKKNSAGIWAWRKNRILTWQNYVEFNLDPYHLQCLMVRRGVPYIPYSAKGEDAEFYARLFKMSADRFSGELTGITQLPELIAHYRKRMGSITNSSGNNEGLSGAQVEAVKTNTASEQSMLEYPEGVPPFYVLSGVPDKYITHRNISHWATKRWLRIIFRAIFRGNIKSAIHVFKKLLNDKRIRKRDLIGLTLKQLFMDTGVRDLGGVLIKRMFKK